MTTLIVVENPKLWSLKVPGVEIVPAREYLTDKRFVAMRRAKVFNLCRTSSYQTLGYYVSLLAAARGHKPLPSVTTIQDLRLASLLRIAAEDLEDQVQRVLGSLTTDRFVLSIYFGRNLAKKYDRLCQAIFGHFPAPLLRAEFVRVDKWRLNGLRTTSASEIPEAHLEFVVARALKFFANPHVTAPKQTARFDLAILVDPEERHSPSEPAAIRRFVKAAESLGMSASIIDRHDYGRIGEYDGLFIRATTQVDHYTYRFARRAEAEGLVVIDDPESIVRCSNKVYQAEIFEKHKIPCPKTLIAHRDNAHEIGKQLGFPCVLKQPDSSFSTGVVKAKTEEELKAHLDAFFETSELVVAQEFLQSTFDWRVGIIDQKPLFVCKYYMARGHWQIRKAQGSGSSFGKVETLAVEDAPAEAVSVALAAANLIGRGLYGVDVKEVDGRFVVIEINDNPNVDVGCEDKLLKGELYKIIMGTFYSRLEARVKE